MGLSCYPRTGIIIIRDLSLITGRGWGLRVEHGRGGLSISRIKRRGGATSCTLHRVAGDVNGLIPAIFSLCSPSSL